MCNEDLAVRIRNGERDLMPTLWEQNIKLFQIMATSLYTRYRDRCISSGVTPEDIFQVGYFALLDAVEAFTPASGYKLSAYINFPLLKHFKTLIGIRTTKRDPLHQCGSLDKPIGEDGDMTLLALIEDSDSTYPFDTIIDDVFFMQVRNVLKEAISRLPAPCATCITGKYFEGKTPAEIAAEIGQSADYVRRMERQGLYKLHRDSYRNEWATVRDEIITTLAYRHRGVRAFWNTWTSSVEYAAIRSEELTAEEYSCPL